MKNHKLNGIICVVCNKNDAELLHHIDYKNDVSIPACQICHKKIHSAIKNPKHFSKSKYISYAPIGNPTSESISILPEHYSKIKNLNKTVSFSGNIRKICSAYFDYKIIAQLRIGKYRFTIGKKSY